MRHDPLADRFQARGYSLDRGERIIQGHSMAVPVLGAEQRPVLAMMSVSHMELTPQFIESLSQREHCHSLPGN